VKLFVLGSRGLYNGLQSGLYGRKLSPNSKCLEDDFAIHLTEIINTFLEHGFALFKFIEDGSLIAEELTDC